MILTFIVLGTIIYCFYRRYTPAKKIGAVRKSRSRNESKANESSFRSVSTAQDDSSDLDESSSDEEQNVSQRSTRNQSASRASTVSRQPKTPPANINRRKSVPKKNAGLGKIRPFMKQIKHLQNSVHMLIPKACFGRVVREIFLTNHGYGDFRISTEAMVALQESAEVYLTVLFEDSYQCTLFAGRKTLFTRDIQLVRFLRGPNDVGNNM